MLHPIAKSCCSCRTVQPISQFHKFYKGEFDRSPNCMSCNASVVSARDLAKRIKSKPRDLLKSAKGRAKCKGLEFTLTASDIIIPDRCPILGIPIVMNAKGCAVAGSPSIDRLDNNKGYTPDNINIISFRANAIKSDASLDELKTLVKWMESI